jgi:hypothetical protein
LVLDRTRRRRWHALAVAALGTTVAQPAAAGTIDCDLGAGVFLGFTDNALGVPKGTPGSGSDGLILGRLDAGLALTRQFSEHRLAYAFTASRYLRQSGGDILSNSLGWEAAFQPLVSLRLTTSLAATQGRLTSLDVASSSATGGTTAGPTGPRPAAPLLYAAADARQGLSAALSPRWRLLQSLVAHGFWPLEANSLRPISYSGELGLGLERSYARDGISLNTRGLAMQSNEVSLAGTVVLPQYRGYVVEGALGWRHTLTPVWSDYLAGGELIIEAPAGSNARFQPAGLAELSAREETNELSLRVERTATPNVFVGDIFISTRAVVSASAGLGQTQKFQLRGLGSFDWASAIASAGESRGGAYVWQARLMMTYGVPGPLLVSLEYAFTDQQAIAPGSGQTPAFLSFRRNLVMLGLEVKYTSLRPLLGGGAAQAIRGAGNPAEDPRR